jgi:hypothetical protein
LEEEKGKGHPKRRKSEKQHRAKQLREQRMLDKKVIATT